MVALAFYSKIDMVDYLNFEPFGAFGLPFFVPLSWVAYFTLSSLAKCECLVVLEMGSRNNLNIILLFLNLP